MRILFLYVLFFGLVIVGVCDWKFNFLWVGVFLDCGILIIGDWKCFGEVFLDIFILIMGILFEFDVWMVLRNFEKLVWERLI